MRWGNGLVWGQCIKTWSWKKMLQGSERPLCITVRPMIQEHAPRSDGERKANLMIRKIVHLFECFMLEKTMVDFGMLYESFMLRFLRSRGCRRRTKISAIKIPPIAVKLGILNAAHPGLHDSLIFNTCIFDAGWWFGTCFYCFYFSVGNHYSNWRSHIFQRGGDNYHQTVMIFTPSNHRA